MRNFQDIFETRKRSFITAFSICMTVPLNPTFQWKKVQQKCSGATFYPIFQWKEVGWMYSRETFHLSRFYEWLSNLGISEFLHRRQYFFHRYFTKCSKHILSAESLDGSFLFQQNFKWKIIYGIRNIYVKKLE